MVAGMMRAMPRITGRTDPDAERIVARAQTSQINVGCDVLDSGSRQALAAAKMMLIADGQARAIRFGSTLRR
jgi:hypothetical protein